MGDDDMGMVDVSDVTDPTLISIFPYPEVPPDFPFINFNDCGIGWKREYSFP